MTQLIRRDLEPWILEEKVPTSTTAEGLHCLRKRPMPSFDLVEGEVPAMTRIHIEGEERPYVADDSNPGVGPALPPIADLLCVRCRVVLSVRHQHREGVLSRAVAARSLWAGATTVSNRPQREDRPTSVCVF